MKKNRIITTSIREIKKSFKRFLSLSVMSMLGVCVFVGIKMAAPDMLKSLDVYFDNNDVYDIKVLSTLGLTDEDILKINELKGVKKAYGSYSYDVLLNNSEKVLKVIGITEDINKIKIIKGRRPNSNNEILVEESFLLKEKLKIGDKIELSNNNIFNENKLIIVGTIKSPLYIGSGNSSKGVTNLGTGKIDYYVYVDSSNFNIDYYTESYIIVDKAKGELTDSKEYNDLIDKSLNEINKIASERQKARYNEIYNQINNEIVKNEKEGINKLNAAKKELDKVNNKLILGKKELDNSKLKLDNASNELNVTKEKLDNAKYMLDVAKEKLDNGKLELENLENKLNAELSKYKITLEDLIILDEYVINYDIPKEDIINLIPSDSIYYEEITNFIDVMYELELKDIIIELIKNPSSKEDLISKIPLDIPNYDKIIEIINNLPAEEIKNNITKVEYIDKTIEIIPNELPNSDKVILLLKEYKENTSKLYELINVIKLLRSGKKEYEEGLILYNNTKQEYEEGYETYAAYYNEYQNGLSLYNNGVLEYESNLNLYNSKIEEYYNSKKLFELEILKAKEKLNEIPEAKWYIYDRLDDSNYSNFIDDGQSVTNLSKLFPTIFFIVAVLISLISMSRMVEEERGLIGTLKSLGFSNKDIRKKYLIYSGFATILGGILGALIGFFILPIFVWNIYKILYDIQVFSYYYDVSSSIIGIFIATICICGTTLITIRKIVKEKPSDLLRPKAPMIGKRVFLEKITFIWNKINFSNKITIRNLSRYKKRMIMSTVGIMGCTALMLTGFGIKDSIVKVPSKQYGDVFVFDEMVYLTGDNKKEELDEIFNNIYIKDYTPTNMISSMTTDKYSINIFIPEDEKELNKIVNLKDKNTKQKLTLKDNEIIITDKLAALTNKKVGDKFTITNTNKETYEFIISDICENYVGHYVYMNKNTYENNIDKYKTNVVYLNVDNIKNEKTLIKKLLENKNIISVVSISTTLKGIEKTFKSLNSIVLILIILSGALSFVVLYNLSNINISERKREIATLKVLGFTDKEVDNYITKETIILTVIGIIFGLLFGIILTAIIMKTIEINMVRFNLNINKESFIITAFMIMIFTIIVNRIIHFALKKIDMVESLKSVE